MRGGEVEPTEHDRRPSQRRLTLAFVISHQAASAASASVGPVAYPATPELLPIVGNAALNPTPCSSAIGGDMQVMALVLVHPHSGHPFRLIRFRHRTAQIRGYD
jgi:hypothetical protein